MVDVIRRYTRNFDDVATRRKLIPEDVLAEMISSFNEG
jgi:hypothetical protein